MTERQADLGGARVAGPANLDRPAGASTVAPPRSAAGTSPHPAPAPVAPPPAKSRLALRHRLAERGVDRTLLLLTPGLLFLVLLFLYPFGYGLGLSFQPRKGTDAFSNYEKFFSDPYLRQTIWITLKIGVPAALLNVLASVPMAYRMRRQVHGRRLITTILVIPITLGTVMTAQGILDYLGPQGWVNRTLRTLHIVDHPVTLIHNYWGVILSLVISGFPFAFLLTLAYLSGIDPSLEQAAATLGAGWFRRFRHISFPLLAPGLAMTFCLTFVLAFSVFPSAVLVGDPQGATHVISIAAVNAAQEQFDYSMASTIAMIMAAVMLIVVAFVLTLRSTLYRGSTSGGKG
jgi:putative spermidine/putrescine transport system permease protein